ncbi:MAG: pyruvate kinase [Bacteroidetes bacterium]|jgi:pyruvate kinase|nr:pyruvate kinase [Bacteroidota bacterium]MBT5530464.1 pyruvate kinase [Cytophagia bacterium]MBT3423125.1 pyruvate kinase [Bacteroidota bacterium]MBT3802426.1 pyruvate kinase [Bacteroidota bacterium]MBT3935817.1 pyruvate kinase [Bacteroidota bacterium]
MRHERSQTKTIVTLGPACSNKEVLRQMFMEGVDVCRLNFSHGSHKDHLANIQNILELDKELNANVAVLADLQGPKLRIGEFKEAYVVLKEGDVVSFVTQECYCTQDRLYMTYKNFPKDVKIDEYILIDDGKIRLKVLSTNQDDEVKAVVLNGGKLSSKKGVNLPDTQVSLPCLTEKDLADLHFALDHGVDWIALSFVRNANDVKELKRIIKERGKEVSVVAKIEKPEALDDIDRIIDVADAIMIARGDLGVEVSFDKVPIIQKDIIKKCIEQATPVIVATQMMESMITNFEPTRAEATDVANAVVDGADALMLSGETSVGKYPIEAIRNMQKIIDYTEENGFEYNRKIEHNDIKRFLADSMCDAARKLTDRTKAHAIITFTHSGYSAFRISSYRPKASLFVFTQNRVLLRRMSLVWGVRSYLMEKTGNADESIQFTIDYLKGRNLIRERDIVVHIGSIPLDEKGKTNMVKLSFA